MPAPRLKFRRRQPIQVWMDISGLAALGTQMAQQRTAQTAQLFVLKKAMQLQESAAMTLIGSVTPTPTSSLPEHLGRNVNIVA